MQPTLEIIATTPMGLEAVVAREVEALGYEERKVENGRVVFRGDPLAVCRANLWLRSADRVLIKMAEFHAVTFDELFEGTKAVDWPGWMAQDACFPVQGRSHKSQLSSVPACQSIVKKAIVEKMKAKYHSEWFPEDGVRYAIEVSLLKDIATITLDTSGSGLHKRGYRKHVTDAPLKETMAAALVQLSRWSPDRPLVDPFCGSGTIAIEAAMIGWNIAPGLRRTFDAEHWPTIPEERWEEAREEAYDGLSDEVPLDIRGSDIDPSAIEVAEKAVRAAGLAGEIHLSIMPAARLKLQGEYGCLITNPPYGERLSTMSDADRMIRELGRTAQLYDNWSSFILSASKQFEQQWGKPADKKRKLYNGRIETQFFQYFGPFPPKK